MRQLESDPSFIAEGIEGCSDSSPHQMKACNGRRIGSARGRTVCVLLVLESVRSGLTQAQVDALRRTGASRQRTTDANLSRSSRRPPL